MPECFACCFDRASMSLEAAEQGLGIALESDRIGSQFIETGRLRPVFQTEWSLPIRAHFLVYPERQAHCTKVKQFLGWIREQAGCSCSSESLRLAERNSKNRVCNGLSHPFDR
jgi:LysR family glycine cleavage system transcriptional activator